MYRVMRAAKPIILFVFNLINPLMKLFNIDLKEQYELTYWQARKSAEGTLGNAHYEHAYTSMLGLPKSFYDGKKILDIGCGPRGSLEWATNASERVGLDPLVDQYKQLGIDEHAMDYVNAPSENIPFDDQYFDVVLSLNSLDHVENLGKTLSEIKRVTAIGGECILMVHVHPAPTIAEPIVIPWNLTEQLTDVFDVIEEKRYKIQDREGIIPAILRGTVLDTTSEYSEGVLYTRLRRRL